MAYRDEPDSGSMALGAIIAVIGLILLAALLVFGGILNITGQIVDEAVTVAHKELGPEALAKKYQWFKEVAATLDQKKADIEVHEHQLAALAANYTNKPRSQWPRDDREQHNLLSAELSGMKISYNGLASEYNARMAEINWRFTNVGDLPKGATTLLPREYRAYLTK